MKLLVANSGAMTEAHRRRADVRAWNQRILWIVNEGDVLILPDTPDEDFLRHVSQVRSVDFSRVKIRIPPPGAYQHRMIDPRSLLDRDFVAEIRQLVGDLEEIFALYPASNISEFSAALGVRGGLPGADFFDQDGAALADSKATFRAVAAGAGVRLVEGAVCRDPGEACRVLARFIESESGAMVKRVIGSGGSGNEVLLAPGRTRPTHLGARRTHDLGKGVGSVADYLEDHWEWASDGDRQPVVIERLMDPATSIYAEFMVAESGASLHGTGVLDYSRGRIVGETVGLGDVGDDVVDQLVGGAEALADAYRSLGYRGYLCADALVTQDHDVLFTEVNARSTTGTCLHRYLSQARLCQDRRLIKQRDAPHEWGPMSTRRFTSALAESGMILKESTSQGVLMTIPADTSLGSGSFLYTTVCHPGEDEKLTSSLDELFGKAFS